MRTKYQSTAKDGSGKVIIGATITVYLGGTGTLADVYTASSGGSSVNSVTSDSSGFFYFWVDETDYPWTQTFKLNISKTGFRSSSYDDIVIFQTHDNFYYPEASATDQGITGDNNTIKYYVDLIGSDEGTIYLQHDSGSATTTYTLTTSETIPSNITLEIERGAILDGQGRLILPDGHPYYISWRRDFEDIIDDIGSVETTLIIDQDIDLEENKTTPSTLSIKVLRGNIINGTFTLTCNGQIEAGEYQIFGSSITVLFGDNIPQTNIKWFGATGDNTTNDTTALNQAIVACNNSAGTLFLPSGTYRATPGSLNVVETSIYAPEAIIRAHTDADSNLLKVDLWGYGNYKRVILKALIGYNVSDVISSGWPDPADRDGTGLYLGTDHIGGTVFEINYIAGFTSAIKLDGLTNDVHIASNKFNIQSMIANNFGLVFNAGISYPCEANRFNIEYMLKQDYHVYMQSYPDSATEQRVCSNEVNIVVMETQTDGSEIGFNLYGTNTYQNDLRVTGSFVWNAGSGDNVVCSSAHDNRFQLTGIDFTKTTITAANIFDLHTRAFDYPTSSNHLARSVIAGTAAPTDGYWRPGDICWNSAPDEGGDLGWVCTTEGSPGTWNVLGTISGNGFGEYRGLYDFSEDGGGIGDIVIGTIPDNTTITKAHYEVITPFTSAGAATVAISTSQVANEIVTATAYNNAVFNAGAHDAIPDGTAANFTTKSTAARNIILTIATADLTAGKIYVYYEYVVSE